MIFKEIDNMKDVEDICHYFRFWVLVKRRRSTPMPASGYCDKNKAC